MKVHELIGVLNELEQDKIIVFSVGDVYFDDLGVVEVGHFKDSFDDNKMKKGYCLYAE